MMQKIIPPSSILSIVSYDVFQLWKWLGMVAQTTFALLVLSRYNLTKSIWFLISIEKICHLGMINPIHEHMWSWPTPFLGAKNKLHFVVRKQCVLGIWILLWDYDYWKKNAWFTRFTMHSQHTVDPASDWQLIGAVK